MPVMLLAMLMSDSTLKASDVNAYRIVRETPAGSYEADAEWRTRTWKPGIDGWKVESADCRALLKREIEGFGSLRIGPSCNAELEAPYAL